MCGIYCRFLSNQDFSSQELIDCYFYFQTLKHRGPDESVTIAKNDAFLGFHRLCINDVAGGSQPFHRNGLYLVCNGEVYNYDQLISEHKFDVQTKSDCEPILHLFEKYRDIKTVTELIDGDFAFVLFDSVNKKVYFATDRFGVRPLFVSYTEGGLILASEAKADSTLIRVNPRYVYTYDMELNSCTGVPYFAYPSVEIDDDLETSTKNIRNLLELSVSKRLKSDQEIGVFLSGGLDSSLVLSILLKILYENNDKRTIQVFSIGVVDTSPDVANAKKVVSYLKHKYGDDCIKHHIIPFSEKQGIISLRSVIECTESYDTTTIRASTPMYIMSEYVRTNTNVKVIMSGEGSDELFGGYLYFHFAPDEKSFKDETVKLLSNIHFFDGLRVDRTTAAFGLEVRVPFLDKDLVNYVLSLKNRVTNKTHPNALYRQEKSLLRMSFKKYLPNEILFLKKNAMSDAVGKSWVEQLKDYCKSSLYDGKEHKDDKNPDTTWIKKTFEYTYPGRTELIPYYWLPSWINTNGESSARVFYDEV